MSYKGLHAVVFQLVAGLVRTAFTGPVERRRNVDGEILRLAGYSQHTKDYEQYKNGPEHDQTPSRLGPIVVCSLFFMTKSTYCANTGDRDISVSLRSDKSLIAKGLVVGVAMETVQATCAKC